MQDLLGSVLARQAHEERRYQGRAKPDKALVTRAMTIDTRRAPARVVSLFPLWCYGSRRRRGVPRHQAKVAISVQRDQDQKDGKTEVIVEPKTASPPELFAGEDRFCQDSLYWLSPFKLPAIVGSLPAQYLGRGPGPL